MRDSLRQVVTLVGTASRSAWYFSIGFAVVVGLLEALGAILVLSVLSIVAGQSGGTTFPVLGSLEERFPNLSEDAIFLVVAIVVSAFFILRGTCYLLQAYMRNKLAHDAATRVAVELFTGYLRMPYEFHLRRNSAELIRNLHTSTYELVDATLIPLVGLVSEGILVIAILLILVLSAPLATFMAALALTPVVLAVSRFAQPRLATLGNQAQDLHTTNLKVMQQGFQGFREIRILGTELMFSDAFSESRSRVARTYYLRSSLIDAPRVIVETALIIFILAFTVVAGGGGSEPETLAILGLFAYAALRLLPSVNRMLAYANTLKFGSAAIGILTGELPIIRCGQAAEAPPREPLVFESSIKLEDVSFKYEGADSYVLQRVGFQIEKGQSIGIVGETGSGKSTLVDVILGLLRPTQGSVMVDGVDIENDRAGWHKLASMVPQSTFLTDDSLRRNIAFGIPNEDINAETLNRALRVARLVEFVEALPEGLDTQVGERGVRLSGGQRQRIAIARAVYRDPELLILDEGTSALDDATEKEVMNALTTMRTGLTLIVVAHRLSTVQQCDQVILMRSGMVHDTGTLDELRERHPTLR